MLTLTGVLFVTTLATLTNALANELPVVRHECGEKTLCDIKPPDYPQEEIDEMAFKYLRHLHKTKREVKEALEPASPEEGGNCESVTINTPIYTIRQYDKAPKYLVQSKWFTQEIPQVQCTNEKSSCFTAYVIPGLVKNTRCKTKKVATSLVVYDRRSNMPTKIESSIAIGCDCVINRT